MVVKFKYLALLSLALAQVASAADNKSDADSSSIDLTPPDLWRAAGTFTAAYSTTDPCYGSDECVDVTAPMPPSVPHAPLPMPNFPGGMDPSPPQNGGGGNGGGGDGPARKLEDRIYERTRELGELLTNNQDCANTISGIERDENGNRSNPDHHGPSAIDMYSDLVRDNKIILVWDPERAQAIFNDSLYAFSYSGREPEGVLSPEAQALLNEFGYQAPAMLLNPYALHGVSDAQQFFVMTHELTHIANPDGVIPHCDAGQCREGTPFRGTMDQLNQGLVESCGFSPQLADQNNYPSFQYPPAKP